MLMGYFNRSLRSTICVTDIADQPDGELIARSRATEQFIETESFFFSFKRVRGAGKAIAVELAGNSG